MDPLQQHIKTAKQNLNVSNSQLPYWVPKSVGGKSISLLQKDDDWVKNASCMK